MPGTRFIGCVWSNITVFTDLWGPSLRHKGCSRSLNGAKSMQPTRQSNTSCSVQAYGSDRFSVHMHRAGNGSPSSGCSGFRSSLKGWCEHHAGAEWVRARAKQNKTCDSGGKAVCARQCSPLTLGSILVFFRLRHFSAHRSQFGCVIPDLDKNRNPFNCRLSSMKSLPSVPGAEIRVLWGEK